MRVQSLGHVVLKVRDIRRSEDFYAGTLNIPIAWRITDPVTMTFFTLGNHHDFAIMELGEDAPSPDPHAAGLAHVAFNIGEANEDFESMRSDLEAGGIDVLYVAERSITRSVHLLDPDGNEVELYIDTAASRGTSMLRTTAG